MTPRLRLIDRVVVGLTGLLLVITALVALRWHNRPGSVTLPAPPWLHTSAERWWWPWAMAVAALALIGLALWWLIAHLPRPTHAITRLPDTDPTGQLRLDLKTVADTASGVLRADDAITGAKATIHREHGRDILEITATTTPDDLTAATHAASSVHTQLAYVLTAAPTSIRTLLHLKTPRQHRNRVH